MRKKLAAIEIETTVILMEEGCVTKERKEIKSVTESGTKHKITWTFFFFLINQKIIVSKLQIILMTFSFEAEKKSKKEDLQWEKKTDWAKTSNSQVNIIWQNFEKSSSREINL